MREDRIVLPIPPGMHWSEEMPVLLPGCKSACWKSKDTGRKPATRRRPGAAAATAR